MEQLIINSSEFKIDELLKGFEIRQMPSSNVEYFGSNGKDVFVQFNSGLSYLYTGVPEDTIAQMYKADSIGFFVAKNLVRKFLTSKHEERWVVSKAQTENQAQQ